MRLITKLLLVCFGLFVALPAAAQTSPEALACDAALANLENTRMGKDQPRGIAPDGMRLKAGGPYTALADAPLFSVDAYREHGDVRALCPEARWPTSVKPDGLKKLMAQGAKANLKMFCGGDIGSMQPRVPDMVRALNKDGVIRGFADRILEIQGKLDPASVASQSAARHASDADWLYEVITDLDGVCPNGNEALDIGSAKAAVGMARDAAHDNVAFLACLKARDPAKPQLAAFDAAAKSGDQAAMTAALVSLEASYAPVAKACKSSEEGSRENAYILASKKMQILFLTTPGCRDAAVKMNEIRQSMNASGKSSISSYAPSMRQSAKDAAIACKDPSPETWGNFVAWIAERNIGRLP